MEQMNKHNIYDLRYTKNIGYFALTGQQKGSQAQSTCNTTLSLRSMIDHLLASVLHSANDTLYRFQINNLFHTKFFVEVDAIL